jgi:hypothetical protein
MAIKRRFGEKKGTAKHKGAKGQSYKRKDKNKIKTKAKTANRNLDKRSQKVAIAKATKMHIQTDRNRDLNEAAPAATADTEAISKS